MRTLGGFGLQEGDRFGAVLVMGGLFLAVVVAVAVLHTRAGFARRKGSLRSQVGSAARVGIEERQGGQEGCGRLKA